MRAIDKTNLTGLTAGKKKLLRAGKGVASIPIDFNEIRDELKYGWRDVYGRTETTNSRK